MKTRYAIIAAISAISFVLAACTPETSTPPTPVKTTQAQKAAQAANSVNFNENAEIDNIKKRLELTSQPGLLGFIALTNRVGQVVMYTTVKGKITSGSKRLTQDQMLKVCKEASTDNYAQSCVMNAPSDEGTYGSSNPYIYFWTQTGQYIQTSFDYIYSDKPFRLTEKPLIDLVSEPDLVQQHLSK